MDKNQTEEISKVQDQFAKVEHLKSRMEQRQSFAKLDALIKATKQLETKLKNLASRKRSLLANKTQLCNVIYNTLQHTLIESLEEFYQFRVSQVYKELFEDRSALASSVHLCFGRLEKIREMISDVLAFDTSQEPPTPCSEGFARGYKRGFQDGLSSLREFAIQKLRDIQEIPESGFALPTENISDLHAELPLMGG